MATAHAFNSRHATSSRVEAARPAPVMVAPQPSIADKLASGELYVMRLEDAEDRASGGVYVRTDVLTGIRYAYWHPIRRRDRWQEVAIDTPLCSGCDTPCPDGICSECGA